MDLRELNYILIPRPGETSERWENSRAARALRPMAWLWTSLTPEGVALTIVTLVVGLAGVDLRFSHIYMVFCGLAGLLGVALLLRPLARLKGVTLEVEHPGRVTAGEPIRFTLVVRNTGERAIYGVRVRGPFLPWDGSWDGALPSLPHLAPGETTRLQAVARFDCRGERFLGRFSIASVRPLGLVSGPRVRSEPIRIVVLPRVPELCELPWPSSLSYQRGGLLQASASGESWELLGLRDYRPGDRPRDIHARSWARLGRPVVREFRQEFYRRAAVLLHPQASRVSRTVVDAAVELCAGVARQIVSKEALVDVLVASEPPRETVLGCHLRQIEEALDLLATVETSSKAPQTSPMALLEPRWDQLSAVYLVLLGWDEARQRLVEELRGRGLVVQAWLVSDERPGRLTAATAAGVQALHPRVLKSAPAEVL